MRAKANDEQRRIIYDWDNKKRALGTVKALARRLDLPYTTVANIIDKHRQKETGKIRS